MNLPPDPPDYDAPLGVTVFCEDIRHELDGKFTLVGVMQGNIFLPQFPTAIAKFGVSANYRQPRSFPRDVVELRVLWKPEGSDDRRVLVNIPIDMRAMAVGDGPWLMATTQMVISPLHLTEPGTLMVRAYREGQPPLRMGAINFATGEAPESISQPPAFIPFTPGQPIEVAPSKLP